MTTPGGDAAIYEMVGLYRARALPCTEPDADAVYYRNREENSAANKKPPSFIDEAINNMGKPSGKTAHEKRDSKNVLHFNLSFSIILRLHEEAPLL